MPPRESSGTYTVAEFFAGIGLVRCALEQEGFKVVFANDIEPSKRVLYAANFDAAHFHLGDVRGVQGAHVPPVDLATASFPCTDLSLAGNRAGLAGNESGMFWEFARVLDEMPQRPRAVLLENVIGFATSHGGKDMLAAVAELNRLGYWCDIFVMDARWFVPQSRPRMFVVGSQIRLPGTDDWFGTDLRPLWVRRFTAGIGICSYMPTRCHPFHDAKPRSPMSLSECPTVMSGGGISSGTLDF
jgi:DNA (cytosine-5)-methyltransferase 1